MRVAFTFNLKRSNHGRSEDANAEFDTPETIEAIRKALEASGNHVIPIEADRDCYERLKASQADIVFNWAEGFRGECRESQVPAMLEMLGMPYVGSGPIALALALDKARTKEVAFFHSIPAVRFQVFESPAESPRLPFPVIVKPLAEGSSKGIRSDSVARSREELQKAVARVIQLYSQPAIAEEFLDGREFTVSLLGNHNPIILPIIEKNFGILPEDAPPIESWDVKWSNHESFVLCPAKVPEALERRIKEVALSAFRAFGCRDWCRVDVRMKQGSEEVYLLELNPIPGLLPDPKEYSYFPTSGRAEGLSFEEIVNAPVLYALERCGMLERAGEYYARLSERLRKLSGHPVAGQARVL